MKFGLGYEYNPELTKEQNRAAMIVYYAKQGQTIRDLNDKEEKEIDELMAKMEPEIDAILSGK